MGCVFVPQPEFQLVFSASILPTDRGIAILKWARSFRGLRLKKQKISSLLQRPIRIPGCLDVILLTRIVGWRLAKAKVRRGEQTETPPENSILVALGP